MSEIKKDPRDGLYLFFNRSKNKVKGLSWHKNGFVLFYKRLEIGHFQINFNKETGSIEVQPDEFGWLLAGLEWQKMRDWRELKYDKFS